MICHVLVDLLELPYALPRNLPVEKNPLQLPSMTETKKMPVRTPVFGSQKCKNQLFFKKISKFLATRQGVCLGHLDGSFCAIKTGLKTVPF